MPKTACAWLQLEGGQPTREAKGDETVTRSHRKLANAGSLEDEEHKWWL